MEKKESYNGVELSQKKKYRLKLMVSILKGLVDTPLVLKGGTALFLGYGLTRFSEDLDFDSSVKLNLIPRIKKSIPYDIDIDNISVKKDTQTVSRYIVNYSIPSMNESASLKIEISYRSPISSDDIYESNGIRFASVEKLIDYKLKAAYDGETTRSKVRDLFDLHFLAFHFSNRFSKENAERLHDFAKDPGILESRYKEDLLFDDILRSQVDLEFLSLELSEQSEYIINKIEKENLIDSNVIDKKLQEISQAQQLDTIKQKEEPEQRRGRGR